MSSRCLNFTRPYAELSHEDQIEIDKFRDLMKRRRDKPDEPMIHAYAEIYGEVVFEDKEP